MIALYAFSPRYCPVCGHAVKQSRDNTTRTHECIHCGLRWSKADLDAMLKASDESKSDLRRWV